VQVINRVGWDGAIRKPDANELGWKETVKTNPLEDIIVALRPVSPKLVFGVPDSVRAYDPTQPLNATWAGWDPLTGNPITVVNQKVNFGWEYVWHCHLLGHEENDMMRPMMFTVARSLAAAPVLNLTGTTGTPINLSWTDGTPFDYTTGLPTSTIGNSANEVGFRVERAPKSGTGAGVFVTVATVPANHTTYIDNTTVANTGYTYRVVAFNAAGDSPSNALTVGINRYEQTDSRMLYVGTWPTLTDVAMSGGSLRYASASGASVTISFNGTWLGLIARTGPNYGRASISVDGGGSSLVDLYSSAVVNQRQVWATPALAAGNHTVRILYSGSRNAASTGTTINIDAVDVAGTLNGVVAPPTVTGIVPTSGSTAGGTSVAITGTNLTAATAVRFGATNATSFTVNSATSITATSPAGAAGTVDITVTTAGGTSATSASDRFTYISSVTRYEQTNPLILFTGTWPTLSDPALSGGSLRYASASGARVNINFTGTNIVLIARSGPNYGRASISVDGGTSVLVDLYSAAIQNQRAVWNSGPLASGAHTVRILYTGSKTAASTAATINIDAVDITGVLN
jgi:hypothetical protein